MKQNKTYIVAVTGGIATGKSTAINYIKLRGYKVIDFDEISHEVLNNKIVINELVNAFGKSILENEKINRKKLGSYVFSDKVKLETLNTITHNRIYNKASKQIQENEKENILFLDIPLLYETKVKFEEFYKVVDEVWVISSNPRVQATRLMIRDKINIDIANKKIKSQMNLRLKERLGNVIFYNNSDIYALYEDLRIELFNLEKRVKGLYEKKEL